MMMSHVLEEYDRYDAQEYWYDENHPKQTVAMKLAKFATHTNVPKRFRC